MEANPIAVIFAVFENLERSLVYWFGLIKLVSAPNQKAEVNFIFKTYISLYTKE